jgi:hypothetical protein
VDDFGNPLYIPFMIFMIPMTAMLGAFIYLIVRTMSRSRSGSWKSGSALP